jgi:hypothetical protein
MGYSQCGKEPPFIVNQKKKGLERRVYPNRYELLEITYMADFWKGCNGDMTSMY